MNRTAQEQLNALAALKNDPRFAARSVSFRADQESELLRAIGNRTSSPIVSYNWGDYLTYIRESKLPTVARSFSTAAAAVVLMLGGWITTVDAAANSLPGDALYGLKLVTEQVRLRLAPLEQRAVLHTEFAERRLNEVVALQHAGTVEQKNVEVAVAAFRSEITSANTELQALVASGSADALETATAVEGKLTAFDAALNETAATSANAEVSTQIEDAKDAARETQSTAVAVVVDTHEEQASDYSQRELQEMFQQELGALRGRQTFDLHRVEVVQNSLVAHAVFLVGVTVPTTDDFKVITYAITNADKGISEAMNLFAIGGYRGAFDKLRSVDGELLLVEARLAQVEITIITALSAPPTSPPAEPNEEPLDTPTTTEETVPS